MESVRKSKIRALIFDFDGLILDTEGPIFQSWQELYQFYGCVLSLSDWANILGTYESSFDPEAELERQTGSWSGKPASPWIGPGLLPKGGSVRKIC